MRRYDRKASEQALIEAVGRIVSRDGIASLGVNAIAREAKVNKALIYRYFGSLNDLYVAYVEQSDLWPTPDEVLGPDPERLVGLSWAEIFADIMPRYAAGLRRRPHTLELLAAELSIRNELIVAFEEVREVRSQQTYERLATLGIVPAQHVAVLLTIFSGAVNYLTVRARTIRWFAGIEINTDEFWERELEATFKALSEEIRGAK